MQLNLLPVSIFSILFYLSFPLKSCIFTDQFVDETGENQLNEEQHPDNEQEIQSSGMIFNKMMVSGEKGK